MKQFKLKIKNEKTDFELEAEEINTEEEWEFIKQLLASANIEVTTSKTNEIKKAEKTKTPKIADLKEGYAALETDVKGLYHAKSEFESMQMVKQFPKTSHICEQNEKVRKQFKPLIRDIVRITPFSVEPSRTSFHSLSVREINGEKCYQTFYVCPRCKNKGKHYIKEKEAFVSCHMCPHDMRVRDATESGFPNQDKFGNIYIAGDFVQVKNA